MAERTEVVSTSGVTQTFRPRTSYIRGYGGSVKDVWNQLIAEHLPENHIRGAILTPNTWRGGYGSIQQQEKIGTFSNDLPDISQEPENHARGLALTPKTWFGLPFGSIVPRLVAPSALSYPEEGPHVSPEIEEALRLSAQRRTWFGGGQKAPVEGTFG